MVNPVASSSADAFWISLGVFFLFCFAVSLSWKSPAWTLKEPESFDDFAKRCTDKYN